jgi:Low molecular weight phosphotyrosine protein phosphatase
VRPEAIAVMKEVGIDISGHRSKSVDEFAGRSFDYLLTVCDNAKESCPVYPGHANRLHHAFEDPATAEGSEDQRLALFRRVHYEIRDYLKTFPREEYQPLRPTSQTGSWVTKSAASMGFVKHQKGQEKGNVIDQASKLRHPLSQ